MKAGNFSEWYNELLVEAEIMDVRYPIKGLYVWFPFGFTLRKLTYDMLRSLLDRDHQEAYFPLLIPENELLKESEHIKGFEEEVFWVTKGGFGELDVPLALRPTSETAIYPMFSIWIRSHADLPLRIYQIVNTFRYETKHTRPLIRLREITSFKEAHTAHASWEDAKKQTEAAVALYKEFYDRLGIPCVVLRRPQWDRFPGADFTIAFDTLMPDGKSLQIGTIHHLSTNFAETFDIKYEDRTGNQQFVNQTCYGISERCIAAIISVHGDDKGLVLPPEIAPTQIVIIPIFSAKADSETVMNACTELKQELSTYRVVVDAGAARPGAKFYKWEKRGVPIRLEVGPKDISKSAVTLVRRDTSKKEAIGRSKLLAKVAEVMNDILENISQRAQTVMRAHTISIETPEQAKGKKGFFQISWCGSESCGLRLQELTDADILGEAEPLEGQCPICETPTTVRAFLARPY
ncbi:MAG TPA: proline--tRNA ligase [Candidatus Bathyarchaeia archaeon]|nr:proline--tRNA ligase [Candidatus Bathyarchaeia archaeon]